MTSVGSLNPFDGLEDEEEEEEVGGKYDGGQEIPLNERTPAEQCEYHWRALESMMATQVTNPFFTVESFQEHLQAIQKLLIKERPETPGQLGDCLAFLLSENVVEGVYLFSTRQRIYGKELRITLLRFFTEVFTYASQPILIHQQILRPLSRLLRLCEGVREKEPDLGAVLVPLLHRLCILMQENQSLLDLFFTESKVHLQAKFIVFSQLIPHMHEAGEVGIRARDALLLCLSLAAQLPGSNLSQFITTDSNFCQVLATGLSGLYSELPTSREVHVGEWQSPLTIIEQEVPELRIFLQALNFCNSVLQMAPKVVCDTVLILVREGFLQQVMGSALLQSSEEAVMFATAYLLVFLTNISNVPLMREFLRYLCLGQYDGRPILSALIQNISSPNEKLCSVTLELFHELLDLNCEDLMLELVFKHLLSGEHVMPNQLAIVGAPDIYSQAARKFLQLLPTVCINAEKRFLESIKEKENSTQSSPGSSRAGSPPPPLTSTPTCSQPLEKPTPHHLAVPLPTAKPLATGGTSTNPFDLPPVSRSRSGSNASSCSSMSLPSLSGGQVGGGGAGGGAAFPPANPVSTPGSTGTTSSVGPFQFKYIPMDVAYLYYRETAREAVTACAERCQCWSNSYDRCDVSKETQREELLTANGSGSGKALEMEDVLVRVKVTSEGGREENNLFESSLGSRRSRSVTVSYKRPSRTASLRVHNRLHPGRVVTGGEGEGDKVSQVNGQDTSESPRTSPRLSRRKSDDARSRFEDKAGLLIKILLEKLTEMLQLTPTVNILLTRLISRLAQYPHPLLRSLLLNHHLVLRPGVPSLLYVLQTIKVTIDGYARSQDTLEVRLARARKTMIYLAEVRNSQVQESVVKQMVMAEMRRLVRLGSKASELGDPTEPTLRHQLVKQGSLVSELGDSPSPLKKRGTKMDTSEDPLPRSRAHTEGGKGLAQKRRTARKKKVSTNNLFAITIFNEFLKELAALSQEHSVLNPQLYLSKPVA